MQIQPHWGDDDAAHSWAVDVFVRKLVDPDPGGGPHAALRPGVAAAQSLLQHTGPTE
jgi:hypothetical protein